VEVADGAARDEGVGVPSVPSFVLFVSSTPYKNIGRAHPLSTCDAKLQCAPLVTMISTSRQPPPHISLKFEIFVACLAPSYDTP
jgi:hypothetical protein